MRWLHRKTNPSRATSGRTDLDTPLLDLGGMPWTWRDAYQSTIVMGSTGSGKTSSSIAAICHAIARSGAGGGCLFTVKREDAQAYSSLMEAAGRGRDLVVYSPTNPLRFNFIRAEIEQSPDASAVVENVTALIMTVAELADRSRRGNGGGSENAEYFRQAMLRLCRNALLVLFFSGREVTVTNLHRLVVSAPRSHAEALDQAWQRGFFYTSLQAAAKAPKSESLLADFELAVVFFMEEWADLNTRTRSTVESTFTSATDALSRGMVRDTLSAADCNFSPSMLEAGRIVIFDYPVLVHREVGQIIQVVVKACIQRWLSRREVHANTPGVFLIADECQHLIVAEDERFATTSRSTRTATIWATQSTSTLLEAFGGDGAETRMSSFLGNCQTQLHHQQTDVRTISYLQQLTGRSRQFLMNGGLSRSEDWLAPMFGSRDGSTSGGFSETYEFELQARDLNGLVTGGPPHYFAEVIAYRGGRRFPNGRTWARVAIPQRR